MASIPLLRSAVDWLRSKGSPIFMFHGVMPEGSLDYHPEMFVYSSAIIAWAFHKRVYNSFLYFPLYFSMANGAALYGFVRFFTVGQSTLWRKAER
jgi:hypothetical protein